MFNKIKLKNITLIRISCSILHPTNSNFNTYILTLFSISIIRTVGNCHPWYRDMVTVFESNYLLPTSCRRVTATFIATSDGVWKVWPFSSLSSVLVLLLWLFLMILLTWRGLLSYSIRTSIYFTILETKNLCFFFLFLIMD